LPARIKTNAQASRVRNVNGPVLSFIHWRTTTVPID
jgi:hypothetical protein